MLAHLGCSDEPPVPYEIQMPVRPIGMLSNTSIMDSSSWEPASLAFQFSGSSFDSPVCNSPPFPGYLVPFWDRRQVTGAVPNVLLKALEKAASES